MIGTINREINVETIMNNIKREILGCDYKNISPQKLSEIIITSDDKRMFVELLNCTEQNEHAGTELLPMLRFNGITRIFAKAVGKVVIYLGTVITLPQIKFNQSTRQIISMILDIIEKIDNSLSEKENKILELEKRILEVEKKKNTIN